MDNEDLPHAGCVGTQEHDAGCGRAIGQQGVTVQAEASQEGDARCAPPEPSGHLTEARTPPLTLREFERALRSLGYTRMQAEHIGRKGFTGLRAEDPEPSADSTQLHAALEGLVQALKG